MRYSQLLENKEYNESRKALLNLSYEAGHALKSWEWAQWDSGELSNHFETNNAVAQEIITAFEPIKAMMRRQYGETVMLYRGVIPEPDRPIRDDRILFSWTINPKIAGVFAGQHPTAKKHDIPSVEDITKAVAQYERTGFTTMFNIKYMRNKKQPEYYDMYNRHNHHITDGDNLTRDLTRSRQDRIDSNADLDNIPGKIFKKQIPIDDIIWVLNGGGAEEYIVRGHIE